METGQYVPAGEPQKARNRKPRTRNPTDQGIRDQQPPTVRKSNRGAPQPQQPEVANWGYDQYGNADPAQSYPEHYGYGTGEHVDAHAYGYGSAHVDATGHGYDYDYGYGGAHADAGQDYDYGYDYGHGYAPADAGQDYGYGGAQVDAGQDYGYGGAQVDAGQDYGYVAPTQQVKRVRNPRPVADGHGAGYENQGYEVYNAVVPEQQPSRNPEKRDAKPRKPSRSKELENGNHESPLASRALTGEREGPGSARSRTSQEGSGSNRSSSHHRASNRMEQDTNAIGGTGRSSNPERRKQKVENAAVRSSTTPKAANALNEHLRKAGNGKQPAFQDVSMAVFDPRDRTLVMPEATPGTRPSLDEWMKRQGNVPKLQQDESLIVFDDHDKSELETRMFGAPLANSKQSIKLPPVEEQQPQYQPRGPAGNKNYQAVEPAVEKPLYQPVRRQPAGYANSPGLPLAYQDHVQAGAIQEYNNIAYEPAYEGNIDNKQALQAVAPNAKCMACVHGVGVPLARLATRIACRQCLTCGCTIL